MIGWTIRPGLSGVERLVSSPLDSQIDLQPPLAKNHIPQGNRTRRCVERESRRVADNAFNERMRHYHSQQLAEQEENRVDRYALCALTGRAFSIICESLERRSGGWPFKPCSALPFFPCHAPCPSRLCAGIRRSPPGSLPRLQLLSIPSRSGAIDSRHARPKARASPSRRPHALCPLSSSPPPAARPLPPPR